MEKNVELKTPNDIRYYTDNNGIIAFYEPGLMDQKVHFSNKSQRGRAPGVRIAHALRSRCQVFKLSLKKESTTMTTGIGRLEYRRIRILEWRKRPGTEEID